MRPRAPLSARPLRDEALGGIPGLVHGFTTRAQGSVELEGGPDALDGLRELEDPSWRRCSVRQVHGARTWLVEGPVPGGTEADALVTRRRGELLVIRVADCVPILVASRSESGTAVAVAAIHAGWRGLVAGVVAAALAELDRAAPGAPRVAALGPSIGPCCFEVGPEVAAELAHACGPDSVRPGRGDRSFGDLALGVRRQLLAAGVEVPTVERPPCTRCHADSLHSHRAHGAAAGRMGAFIGLVP